MAKIKHMIQNVKMENDIPAPTKRKRLKETNLVTIFHQMQIGESFITEKRFQGRLYVCANFAQIKITSKEIDKDFVRVWRIE